MAKKRIEVQVFGDEGRIGNVSAYLDDAALTDIAKVVNKHCKTEALNVKSASDDKKTPPPTNE